MERGTKNSFDSYEVTVSRKAGTYYLTIAELYLVVADTNLERGIKQLEKNYYDLERKLIESGQSHSPPRAHNKSIFNLRDYKRFLVKSLIVSGAIIFTLTVSASFVTNKAAQFSIVKLLATQAKMVSHITDRWKNSDDQTKKKVLEAFDANLTELQPFIESIKRALSAETTETNERK